MSKPRFPLSVERYFCYRAKINTTGEILECETFKSLYHFTRSHLRTEVLYKEHEYKYSEAVLEFGYHTDYQIRKGYWYSEWTQLEDFGCMQISTLSETFYRTSDEANHLIRGNFEE